MDFLGFNQKEAVKLGLKTSHLTMLSWIVNKIDEQEFQFKGHKACLINTFDALEDYPILSCREAQIKNLLKKLVDVQVLKRLCGDEFSKFPVHTLGENFHLLKIGEKTDA